MAASHIKDMPGSPCAHQQMKSTPHPSRVAWRAGRGGGWGQACQVSPSVQQCRDPGHISISQIQLSGRVEKTQPLPVMGSPHGHQNQQADGVQCHRWPERALRSNSRVENVGWRVLIPGSLKYITKVPLSLPQAQRTSLWLGLLALGLIADI